ncbi:stage V sporulation protein AC [Heliorestis acidaminivorans]|uniref:Stage V sporulation protein AC n=1 Tax=Heliorestis acidaminivorans TaxID=553427 RepID=A0A6I0EQQ5_9FIRM|nr:stage V sporulation protein AC [Heliorestis acidaminivorans]KAB2951706.1 stage V sporulation protein AC [Heliorestis acidaminivorans]
MPYKFEELSAQDYDQKVQKIKPRPRVIKNAIWAFVVGGLFSALGQIIFFGYVGLGLTERDAVAATAATLIFLGALLTGLGLYDKIGKHAGAGSIIPITGFANAIVAPAMEYKREGYIFGVGAKMFSIAGPVLAYGITVSVLIGLVYYLFL